MKKDRGGTWSLLGLKKAALVPPKEISLKRSTAEAFAVPYRLYSAENLWQELSATAAENRLSFNFVSELVPLSTERKFKARSQYRIMAPLRGSIQNFQRAPPSFIYESYPPS